MYNISEIQDCLFAQVGYRSSNDPCAPVISDSLKTSASGVYINDRQPLITLDNLRAISPNYNDYNYPEYDAGITYNTDEIVKITTSVTGSDNLFYKSLVDGNTGNDPITSPTEWEVVSFFSDWLEQKTKSSIAKLVRNVFTQKALLGKTKTLLENVKFYDGAGRMADRELKRGRFVGIQFDVHRYNFISPIIPRIGVQFTELQTDLNIYLYHSSQDEPLATFNINATNHTKAVSMQWIDLNWRLKYFDVNTDAGGSYYLGYYEDDLTGQAIYKSVDYSKGCNTCRSSKSFNLWNKYFTVKSIEVNSSDIELDKSIWDVSKNRYGQITNWGLNFEVSSECDVSDFICDRATDFIEPIITQVTYDLLQEMALSVRNSGLEGEVKGLSTGALQGIDQGNRSYIMGIQEELNEQIESMSFDLSDLNSPCLPCNNKHGIKWTAI